MCVCWVRSVPVSVLVVCMLICLCVCMGVCACLCVWVCVVPYVRTHTCVHLDTRRFPRASVQTRAALCLAAAGACCLARLQPCADPAQRLRPGAPRDRLRCRRLAAVRGLRVAL